MCTDTSVGYNKNLYTAFKIFTKILRLNFFFQEINIYKTNNLLKLYTPCYASIIFCESIILYSSTFSSVHTIFLLSTVKLHYLKLDLTV